MDPSCTKVDICQLNQDLFGQLLTQKLNQQVLNRCRSFPSTSYKSCLSVYRTNCKMNRKPNGVCYRVEMKTKYLCPKCNAPLVHRCLNKDKYKPMIVGLWMCSNDQRCPALFPLYEENFAKFHTLLTQENLENGSFPDSCLPPVKAQLQSTVPLHDDVDLDSLITPTHKDDVSRVAVDMNPPELFPQPSLTSNEMEQTPLNLSNQDDTQPFVVQSPSIADQIVPNDNIPSNNIPISVMEVENVVACCDVKFVGCDSGRKRKLIAGIRPSALELSKVNCRKAFVFHKNGREAPPLIPSDMELSSDCFQKFKRPRQKGLVDLALMPDDDFGIVTLHQAMHYGRIDQLTAECADLETFLPEYIANHQNEEVKIEVAVVQDEKVSETSQPSNEYSISDAIVDLGGEPTCQQNIATNEVDQSLNVSQENAQVEKILDMKIFSSGCVEKVVVKNITSVENVDKAIEELEPVVSTDENVTNTPSTNENVTKTPEDEEVAADNVYRRRYFKKGRQKPSYYSSESYLKKKEKFQAPEGSKSKGDEVFKEIFSQLQKRTEQTMREKSDHNQSTETPSTKPGKGNTGTLFNALVAKSNTTEPSPPKVPDFSKVITPPGTQLSKMSKVFVRGKGECNPRSLGDSKTVASSHNHANGSSQFSSYLAERADESASRNSTNHTTPVCTPPPLSVAGTTPIAECDIKAPFDLGDPALNALFSKKRAALSKNRGSAASVNSVYQTKRNDHHAPYPDQSNQHQTPTSIPVIANQNLNENHPMIDGYQMQYIQSVPISNSVPVMSIGNQYVQPNIVSQTNNAEFCMEYGDEDPYLQYFDL